MWLCVEVDILIEWGKHLHDGNILQKGEVSAHKTNLTWPRFM